MHRTIVTTALLAGLAASTFFVPARADSVLDQAKQTVIDTTKPRTTWDGPTSSPKPEPGKHIVFLSLDEQNDASREWGQAVKQAGEKIGWTVTIIDGRGSPKTWIESYEQAIALKADGIITTADIASLQGPVKEGAQTGHHPRRHPWMGAARPEPGPRGLRQHPAGSARRRDPWQRRDHVAAGFGLPPRVDDRAALAADVLVVPHPGFRIDRLADGAEQAQASTGRSSSAPSRRRRPTP